jgi:glycoside/pentoside/hexuronide:cation symporter, GPH family
MAATASNSAAPLRSPAGSPESPSAPGSGAPSSTPGGRLTTNLAYGFGAVAFGVKDNGFAFFLLFYYNQVLGLPAAWVGGAIMIALVIDAFADPIIGYFSDNLRSPWGRRHPLMYGSIVPIALSYYFLWNPPAGLSGPALFGYLVAFAVLVRTFVSVYEIPSSALVAELTDDYHQRTTMLGYRYFFGWWGGLTIAVLAYTVMLVPTAQYADGQLNPQGYQTYGIVASLLMAASVLISSLGTQRNIPFLRQPPPRQAFSLPRIFGELWESMSNRSFMALFVSSIFAAMAAGMASALNIYFTTYFWELTPGQIAVITFGPFISSSVALAVAPWLSRRLGKKTAAVLSSAGSVFLSPLPIVARLAGLLPENGAPALVPMLTCFYIVDVTFVVVSGILVSSMVTDTVEDSELATGRRSEGVFFAARAFIAKSVSGVGVFSATLLLAAIGFSEGAAPSDVDPAVVHRLGLVYVPLLTTLYAVSIALIAGYRISHATHEENLRRLAAR